MSKHFCMTASGRLIDFVEPDPLSIDLFDIAGGLAVMPRWGGQTRWLNFAYSVAQHSVLVAGEVEAQGGTPAEILGGLLHDAFEGLGGCDVPTPLKRLCDGYSMAEVRVLGAIFARFGLPREWAASLPAKVKAADAVLLATEARDLCHPEMALYVDTSRALTARILPWPPRLARLAFVRTFDLLTRGDAPSLEAR